MQHLALPRHYLTAAALLLAVAVSALVVVYISYSNRQLFAELQQLQAAEAALQLQRGQLLLEESAWSSPAVIEKIARSQLVMAPPTARQLSVVIDPALALAEVVR